MLSTPEFMIAVLPALVQRPAWRSPSRSALMQQQDSGDELAAQFAAERTRRQQPQQQPPKAADPGEEPFAGVREIVLDADGAPRAIPKRPPPATFAEQARLSLSPPFSASWPIPNLLHYRAALAPR